MKHLLDFQNVEKENLEKIINSILKLNIQKLKKLILLLFYNLMKTQQELDFHFQLQLRNWGSM